MDISWLFTVPVLKLSIKIAVGLSALFLVIQVTRWRRQAQYRNPFKKSSQKQKKSKATRRFHPNELPSHPEAIVIGSGTGSLTAAHLMSKAGMKRILVLESHETEVGGCTHVFTERGFEFDVGIHYIGEMKKRSLCQTLMQAITEGQLEWEDMGDPTDFIYTSDKLIPIPVGLENWRAQLLEIFPEEKRGIESFFDGYMNTSLSRNFSTAQFILKSIPLFLANVLIKTGLLELLGLWKEAVFRKSVKDYVQGLTDNQDLQRIFCYSWGDYGTPPSKAPWAMQGVIFKHFVEGGSYPVGGASVIAECMIPAIEEAGGKVFCNAPVSRIIYEGGKVCGVVVKAGGKKEVEIRAPLVISGAGVINTFKYLLPQEVRGLSYYNGLLDKELREPAMSMMSVFIGFDKCHEELEIGKPNVWAHFGPELDSVTDFMKMKLDDILDSKENLVPLLFISFPSTKDSNRLKDDETKYKTTCTLIGPANWDWFSAWEGGVVKNRGDDYDELKFQLAQKFIDRLLEIYPQLEHHISYTRVGSPLTNKTYLGAPFGEIYGLDHTIARFSPSVIAKLRPKTDIPGLYLTGQDVLTGGFMGAAFSGVLTASSILERNLINDLMAYHKSSKKVTLPSSTDSLKKDQ